jgi:hypothetical protein
MAARITLCLMVAVTVLAGCSTSSDPARNVEAYLTARANRDENTLRRLLCAEMEPQAEQEILTFEGVSGVTVEGMNCRRDGDTDRVVCAGKIIASYGTEQNEFPLGAYRIKQEDGEWKWCGESN